MKLFTIKHLCILLGVLFLATFVINVYERISYIADLKSLREETYYIENRLRDEMVIGDKDRFLKITTMYSEIDAKHGLKWSPSNNKKGSENFQGLNMYQKADFFITCYNYEEWLDVPHFTFITLALLETSLCPIARNYWDNGKIKEAGIFQQRSSAIAQAGLYYKRMCATNPNLALKLNFTYTDMSDLFDPLNALKVEALLIWGYMKDFARQSPYYISATHWGLDLMMVYYRSDETMPIRFIFNKGKTSEDARNPLSYWYIFNEYYSTFNKFQTEVNIDMTYLERYKRECSALEWQYIDSWKYVKELKDKIQELDDFKLEAREKYTKMLAEAKKQIEDTDLKYQQLQGIISKGDFENLNDVFLQWKVHFKRMAGELSKEKSTKQRYLTIAIYSFLILLVIVFAIIGIAVVIYQIGKPLVFKIRHWLIVKVKNMRE